MDQILTLPAELTIYTVAELRLQWLQLNAEIPEASGAATARDSWLIDAAAVEEIDAAGVQFLLALWQVLAQKKQVFRLANLNRPLSNALEALGVAALLAGEGNNGAAT